MLFTAAALTHAPKSFETVFQACFSFCSVLSWIIGLFHVFTCVNSCIKGREETGERGNGVSVASKTKDRKRGRSFSFESADSNVDIAESVRWHRYIPFVCAAKVQVDRLIDDSSRTLYQNVSPARANPGGTTNTLHPFSDTPGLCVVDCVCCRWCAAIHRGCGDEVYGSVGVCVMCQQRCAHSGLRRNRLT